MITFETQPDRRRLSAAVRHAHRRMLLPYRIGLVLAVVLLLAALFVFPSRVLAYVWLGCAVFCAVFPPLVVRAVVRASWKLHGIPTTWTFTDEGVHTANALSEGTVRWAALSGVERMPDQLIFRINRQQVFPVRIDGLDAGQRERLFDLLRERGLLPGADR
ncbi:YcxB family protein [Micromonospora sp. B11E3]|uniref:YcxB family protein n=1 Tax=Micromonospora sp. B11E3 TaxID=3153562 RepID=UPI00325D95AE